jgi:hypothetical protein
MQWSSEYDYNVYHSPLRASPHHKNVARELVLALCRYADSLISTGNLVSMEKA